MLALIALVVSILAIGYAAVVPGPAGPTGSTGATGPAGPAGPAAPAGTVDQSKIDAAVIAARLTPVDQARGCASCHVLVNATTGAYTLSYEAHRATFERRGVDTHPIVATDAGLATCLVCHASNPTTEKGVAAPLSIRDIVHPAHSGSSIFLTEFNGNCFSCHNVNAAGQFQVLPGNVTVNDKGVPDPTKIPIPGAYTP